MLRNFQIEGGIALKTAKESFDVWNIYRLASVCLYTQDKRLDCIFEKAHPPGATDIGVLARLSFHDVEFLSLEQAPCGGDIDEIGFKTRNDADLNWLIQEGQQDGSEDLIMRFGPSGHIRVKAGRAEIARGGRD